VLSALFYDILQMYESLFTERSAGRRRNRCYPSKDELNQSCTVKIVGLPVYIFIFFSIRKHVIIWNLLPWGWGWAVFYIPSNTV